MADTMQQAQHLMQQVNNIGFVEFTTQLVTETYQLVIKGATDQLKAYAELVAEVSKDLKTFQADHAPLTSIPPYISGVLQLTVQGNATSLDITDDQATGLEAHFQGIVAVDASGAAIGTSGAPYTIKNALSGTQGSRKLALGKDDATDGGLRTLVNAKLRNAAKQSYDTLITILRLGMQKIVITDGEIFTKLTFHVDALQANERASSTYNRNASSWGVGGGASAPLIGGLFSASLGGGYSSSKLRVNVVNERSTSAINVTADIVGSVKLCFKTETFPALPQPVLTPGP